MLLTEIGNEGFLPFVTPESLTCEYCQSVVKLPHKHYSFARIVVGPTITYDTETQELTDQDMDSFFGIWPCPQCHVENETRLESFTYST